jgi:pimeloyl-ACP methyl ester carboxylesterase
VLSKITCILLTAAFIISPSAVAAEGEIVPVAGLLKAKDGVVISYDRYESGRDSVIIVCPGFFNSKSNRWMRSACGMLSPHYDVIAFDFRGHGKSGGLYTWGSKEGLDLDAVLDYADAQHYKHVGILAFSFGAGVALNEAAKRGDIDSMVLISCPSDFGKIDFRFWEPGMFSDLKDNFECNWEGKGARCSHIFMKKESPLDSARSLKNTSVLLIHGDKDWVIDEKHSKKIYDALDTEKEIKIIKGGMHAERMLQSDREKTKDLVLEWFGRMDGKNKVR